MRFIGWGRGGNEMMVGLSFFFLVVVASCPSDRNSRLGFGFGYQGV